VALLTRLCLTAGMTTGTTTGRAAGVRARARAQIRTEILDVAREHLAAKGAGGLSLRAVARDLGMASSAVYRYFETRDVLLTALIIDAYDALGVAVEEAEGAVARDDLLGRWRQVAGTVRAWALDHPSLYALVYGSPVPGYAAPQDTVAPATRVTRLLADLMHDALASGAGTPRSGDAHPVPPEAAEGLAPLAEFIGPGTTPEWAVRGLMAWTWLFGAVSFEVFGQLTGAVVPERRREVFEVEVEHAGAWLGLTS
jgi:AcrR family transcriptional regulator